VLTLALANQARVHQARVQAIFAGRLVPCLGEQSAGSDKVVDEVEDKVAELDAPRKNRLRPAVWYSPPEISVV
jgi:hypothetical protein